MATSRSVAAMVSVLSAAVSLTHCSTGLGVRAATTLPVMSRASSRAPRLQITFIVPRSFRSPEIQAEPNLGGPLYLHLLHIGNISIAAVVRMARRLWITPLLER